MCGHSISAVHTHAHAFVILQARDSEVEAARTQLAGVIQQLDVARKQSEGLLRRVRVLEGREQVRFGRLGDLDECSAGSY